MRHDISRNADDILARQRKRRIWLKIVGALSCAVVFCTTYALILPAITLEKKPDCAVEEHTHTESCYTQVEAVRKTVPICTLESLAIHRHSDGCKDENGVLCCGEADFVVHTHDGRCYDENGQLWCPIPEKQTHTHDGSCYTTPDTHVHGESCYQKEQVELICTQSTEPVHTHGEGCYAPEKKLVCTLTESEGHQHGEGCKDCTQTESAGHKHGEGCYESVLTCTQSTEPAHVHTDECYTWKDVLTCTQSTEPAEPTLTCEKEEIRLHEHTQKDCYKTDENGSLNLTCTQTRILKHVHTDSCLQTTEEPVDPKALTCQLEESESHQHSALCYGVWELSCGLEEHTHTESCDPQATTAPQKELVCTEEHEHTESCYPQETTAPQKELVCTEEHTHTEDCYKTVENKVESQTLTCQLEESESHQHGPLCYGIQQLNTALSESANSAEGAGASEPSTPSGEPTVRATPLVLDSYITNTGTALSYRVSPNTEWQKVDANTTLPGNAELKLDISYDNLPVANLPGAGYQVTYRLPSILRDPKGSGEIKDGNEKMADLTVENGLVTLTFDQTWYNKHHHPSSEDVIKGDFHVQSGIDLTEAEKTPPPQIVIGPVTIGLDFEENLIARYAEVTIAKSPATAIHNDKDGSDYLEYTLTVTAGKDGAPGVVVKDTIQDQSHILGYVGLSNATPSGIGDAPRETGAPEGKAGELSVVDGTLDTMVWKIGDMAPNETRKLTYRVKLEPGYLGGRTPDDTVVNKAELFCKNSNGEELKRDEAVIIFDPQATATISKQSTGFTPDPDGKGGGTIQFTIWIHADDSNNYTLTDVKIWDALDGSLLDNHPSTDPRALPFLSFVDSSFRLHQGGIKDQNGTTGLTDGDGTTVTPVYQKKADGEDNKYHICCNAGTLAPGESKTLIYKVHIDPEWFVAESNEVEFSHYVKNRAHIHAGDKEMGNETHLQQSGHDQFISSKEWCKKNTGVKQQTDESFEFSGKVYQYKADGGLEETTLSKPVKFTAPEGSYKYTVRINHAGDWDVSKATMTDQLSYDPLKVNAKYIGYARVDAYDVSASGRTLKDTVWLAVDGKDKFSFKPESVGWTGNQAYTMTYYTQAVITSTHLQENLGNAFQVSGSVGIGDAYWTLNGSTSTVQGLIEGSNRFDVSKHGWYYEWPKVSSGRYANGAIYWYIQVDADVIPANTYLRDEASNLPNYKNPQSMYDGSSLVGLYTGKLDEDETIADYDDLKDLKASGKLTPLESGYSSTITGESGYPWLTVQLTEPVWLDGGKSLFMIVKTEPHKNPADVPATDGYTYSNGVKSSFDNLEWYDDGSATLKMYGSNGISKALEKVIKWNGTKEEAIPPSTVPAASASLEGLNNGTYVSWKVQLNFTGRLHGSYCVEELIPDGMELTYVQCSGVGSEYTVSAMPFCADKSPGAGWTKGERNSTLRVKSSDILYTTYYYTKGQTARWYVDGLQTGNGGKKTIDFWVVCRVTDGNVLLGCQNKTFQNQVRLLRESNGTLIDSSISDVSLQTQTLSKEGTYKPEEDSSKYPFVVTLNPLGEDLVPGKDTLSLVDTLSNNLKLDLSSIEVRKTSDTDTPGDLVTGWKSAVKGQTLTLTLPDNQALTVTYSAWINAEPGSFISISNNAHWEGYATPSGGSWASGEFEFKISGSGGISERASVEITKLNDHSEPLGNAVFTLTEAEVQADGKTIVEKADPLCTGTTGEDGKLTFSSTTGQNVQYNTIYCVRETQAPSGYVLDSTPHYFVIAQKDESGAYPDFLDSLPTNVEKFYSGSKYRYQALNHKGQITVQKNFADVGGNGYPPVAGTYTFGLYKAVDASGMPTGERQIATITYSATDQEANKTAVFKDLPLDQSYYVFELDAGGNPKLNGEALSDLFEVRYSDNPDNPAPPVCNLTTTNGEHTVTVTNVIYTPELPETGGNGVTVFYAVGLTLLAGAAVLLKKRANAGT